MAYCNLSFSIWFCVFLTLVVAIFVESNEDCPRYLSIEYDRQCLGPLPYYRSLQCKPVFKDGNCCAWRFDCDNLYDVRYKDKCYYNGIEHNIGERIEREDLCGKSCLCERKWWHFADFDCSSREILCPPYQPSHRGCYENSLIQCCPEQKVCQPTSLSGCERNGKTYVFHDFIVPEDDPNSLCYCSEGINRFLCDPFHDWYDRVPQLAFHKNCAPVYSPLNYKYISYNRITWRCQEAGDFIIDKYCDHAFEVTMKDHPDCITNEILCKLHCPFSTQKEDRESPFKDNGCLLINPKGGCVMERGLTYRELCRFGNLSMKIGDTLNSIRFNDQSCIVCICNVPPVPTCFVERKGYDIFQIDSTVPRRVIHC